MNSTRDATLFIDLSYLSSEEEAVIRTVLLRDEDLKRLEIGRVRRLRDSVDNPKHLKVLSGEWFEDLRAKRYGRQPAISAVVRSSMRWKKSAGHRPLPFLNAVPEERDGEKEGKKTRPEVLADPRSTHPALSVEASREYRDEDIAFDLDAQSSQSPFKRVLVPSEEANMAAHNNSNLSSAVLGTGGKPKETFQETIILVQSPILEPATTTTSGGTSRTPAVATVRTTPVAEEAIPAEPSVVTTSFVTSGVKTSTIVPTTSAEPRRKVSLPPALQKDQSIEENWVKVSLEVNTEESASVAIEPESIDGSLPTEVLEIKFSSETSGDQPVRGAGSINAGPKTQAGGIMSSSTVTVIEVEQGPAGAVMNRDGTGSGGETPRSRSLREDPRGAHELHIPSPQGPESSPKLFTLSSMEKMKKQTPPPDAIVQRTEEEIIASDFKRTSPTRMDELEVGVEESPGVPADLNTLLEQIGVENEERLAEKQMNAGPGRKGPSDVDLKDPAYNETVELVLVSEELRDEDELPLAEVEERTVLDTDDASKVELRAESDILANVYARALRAKPKVSKNISFQDPTQQVKDEVPSIVIESPESKEMESVKIGTSIPEAPAERPTPPSFMVDTWEDEGVDSEDDSSSVSSYGSDLSGRRGFSASTLSVTERTGSLLSVYSDAGDFGNVTVQGSVEFALMYSPLGELVIMVEQCQDLAVANVRKQRTDPYVKTYLYPDKRSKRKTSIKKRTMNPVFVESLRYKVKREELPGKTLNLSVWHNDSLGRNVFLGQVEISLKTWDWGHQALTWYNLQPKNSDDLESQEYRGLLSLSLKYVPPDVKGGSKLDSGEIHIWLREAKKLRSLKPQGVDSFVKCYMLPDTSKKSRQKTRVVKKSLNPVYNHTMVYDGFRPDEVREACCELTVWDNNKLSNQFLGGVRLSLGSGLSYGKKVDWLDSANEEVEVWEKMVTNANSWVEADLPLRASMTPRK